MPEAPRHLRVDELEPRVEIAGLWRFTEPTWHRYRLPGHHLLLVLEGRVEAVTPRGRCDAGPGDLLCFSPTEINQYGVGAGTVTAQIALQLAPPPAHRLDPWFDDCGQLPLKVALAGRLARVRELFEAVCLDLPRPGDAARLRVRAAVLEALALAAEAAAGEAPRRAHLDPWQRARARLEADVRGRIALPRLAAELSLGPDQFARRFAARFGLTPRDCRQQARLRVAASRLRTGDEPVKAVAAALGFRDTTAFTRLFRRHFGVLPSQLRGGAALPPPPADAGIVPMNRHLVPPDAPPDPDAAYRPRA